VAKAQRIDWQAIKARWNTETEVFHLALLPKGAAQLFLAICDRLQWEATYRIEGYDYSDWDDLQRIVDLGIAGLTDTMRLSDLLSLVDGVEPLLEALIAKESCCADTTGIEEIFPGWESMVGLPDELDNTGFDIVADSGDPPVGAADWDEWHSKLCEAAQKYADGLPRIISLAETLQSVVQGLTIAALGAIIASSVGLLGVPIVVLGIATTVLDLFDRLRSLRDALSTETAWDMMRQDLDDARQDIVCAIITADTPLLAFQQVGAVITAANPNAWTIIRLLTLQQTVMQRLFNMESDVVGGFYGPCGTCGGQPPSGLWLHQESPFGGFPLTVQDEEYCFTSIPGNTNDYVIVYLYADEERTEKLVGNLTVISDGDEGVGASSVNQYRAYGRDGTLLRSTNSLSAIQGVRCHRLIIAHRKETTPGNFEACLLFEDVNTS